MSRSSFPLAILVAVSLHAQTVQVAKVESKALSRTVVLTGEFFPFQRVDLHARVQGFVERVNVDRGSVVKEGDLLATLSAPEMEAQVAEAESKATAAEAVVPEANAKLAALEATYKRLKEASATPGAIAGNELEVAAQAVEAARGVVRTAEAAAKAAKASVVAAQKMRQYLEIAAPFAGVITERLAHPGALAGPNTAPLLRLEQAAQLRLVVAVPETSFAGIATGAAVGFEVPAWPGRKFTGKVARVARSIDQKTRTMPVELEVANAAAALAPGMYAQVNWPVRSTGAVLVVPASSIVRTTERVFVIRVNGGRAEWVDVRPGARDGAQAQVLGELTAGDMIVLRASDEIRDGSSVTVAPR